MKLILVRHSITIAAEKNYNAGIYDTLLSENGRNLCLTNQIQYHYPKTSYYYSSPLKRCLQTFELLYPEEKLNGIIDDFKERDLGKYENKPCTKDEHEYFDWIRDYCPYQEESYSAFSLRICHAFNELYQKHENDSVTLVAHSAVIRMIFSYLLHLKRDDFRKLYIKNAMAYVVEIKKEKNEFIVSTIKGIDNSSIWKDH